MVLLHFCQRSSRFPPTAAQRPSPWQCNMLSTSVAHRVPVQLIPSQKEPVSASEKTTVVQFLSSHRPTSPYPQPPFTNLPPTSLRITPSNLFRHIKPGLKHLRPKYLLGEKTNLSTVVQLPNSIQHASNHRNMLPTSVQQYVPVQPTP